MKKLISLERYGILLLVVALAVITFIGAFWSVWMLFFFVIFAALTVIGICDMAQDSHAILRNYPLLGHIRYMFETIRPEILQYLIEGDKDEQPFSREKRSLIYQRAKGVEDKRPFGTQEKVYEAGYPWLTHSVAPVHFNDFDFRVKIGGLQCL